MPKNKQFGNTLNNVIHCGTSVCINNMHTEINLKNVAIPPTAIIRQPLYGLIGFFQKTKHHLIFFKEDIFLSTLS
jgi:hypothetical protein